MLALAGVVTGTLDWLFGAVEHDRLGILPAQPLFALHAEQRFRQALDPFDRAAGRAFVQAAEEVDELLRDVAAVVDQHDEQVILQLAGFPGPAGLPFAGLCLLPWATQSPHHRVEHGHTDAGQTTESGAASQTGDGEGLGHRRGTFAVKVLLRLDPDRDRSSLFTQ